MATFTVADRVGSIGGYVGGISALSGMLGNILGGGTGCYNACPDNQPISRYDAAIMQELTAKDSKIALLEADKYTDEKLTEVYKDLNAQVSALKAQIQANKDEQYQINLQQATYNGVNNATISCMQNQITQLMSLTKLVVPNASVCPGWGNVTITPAASTTTTTPAA